MHLRHLCEIPGMFLRCSIILWFALPIFVANNSVLFKFQNNGKANKVPLKILLLYTFTWQNTRDKDSCNKYLYDSQS